jgi:hypothetical protein
VEEAPALVDSGISVVQFIGYIPFVPMEYPKREFSGVARLEIVPA